MKRARIVIAVVFVAIACVVILAGCQRPHSDMRGTGTSGVSGTVAGKQRTKTPALIIRRADGTRAKVFVGWRAVRRCDKGEHYPQCARTGGRS
ncbi:Uncharacterised protein [Mycobacterium tuberculosis]|nr:Uncharacterised protein [Mycobacterium tuberculosis]